jgi:hypothetical protein
MNQPTPIDESLMRRRAVLRALPDPEGGAGWIVELACGHTVWCAVRPMNFTHCGECLVQLAEQARALRDAQKRPQAG